MPMPSGFDETSTDVSGIHLRASYGCYSMYTGVVLSVLLPNALVYSQLLVFDISPNEQQTMDTVVTSSESDSSGVFLLRGSVRECLDELA